MEMRHLFVHYELIFTQKMPAQPFCVCVCVNCNKMAAAKQMASLMSVNSSVVCVWDGEGRGSVEIL